MALSTIFGHSHLHTKCSSGWCVYHQHRTSATHLPEVTTSCCQNLAPSGVALCGIYPCRNEKRQQSVHGVYTQSFPTKDMQLAEIKHGRAAMMAITGFAVQEFLWGSPVIEQTPWFFGR